MRGQDLRGEQIIDSRDVIARIEELEESTKTEGTCANCGAYVTREDEEGARWLQADGGKFCPDGETFHAGEPDEDEAEELAALKELAEEAENSAGDWEHGATLIREDYFETYAQELAEDIGAIDKSASWPNNCIDWEKACRELKYDYSSVTFNGDEYWVRS